MPRTKAIRKKTTSKAKARKYKKDSCHDTKTKAKKRQSELHKKGYTAKLKEISGAWCVESAGKRRTARKKK